MQTILKILMRIRPAFIASFLKKLLRIKRILVSTSSGKFFIDPTSNFGNAILTNVGYEPQLTDALKDLLKEGDTFLDIGANEGYFSVLASMLVGISGKVISIEPQSRLQGILFRNISENAAYNIHVFQKAISDSVGMATIFLIPDMNTGGSGMFQCTKYKNPTEVIPQTTLSELLSLLRLDRIKLMKMDIEGFEYEAILGSKSIFERNIVENIALELHPTILERRKKSQTEILAFLENHGYKKNEEYSTLILSKNCC